MGYIALSDLIPNFSKAVISLWFRLPQSSVDACYSNYARGSTDPAEWGIIPLFTIGSSGSAFDTNQPNSLVVAVHTYFQFNEGDPILSETDEGFIPHKEAVGTAVLSSPKQSLPTMLGIDCSDPTRPTLFINLQTNKHSTVRNQWDFTGVTPAVTYAGITNPGYPPGPNIDAVYDYLDNSAVFYNETDNFVGSSGSDGIVVSREHWHHVLLSFDLTAVETHSGWPNTIAQDTVSYSRMWVSFDDANKTEFALSKNWPDGSSDPNAILTPNGYDIAGQTSETGGTGTHANNGPTDYGQYQYNKPPAGAGTYIQADPTIASGEGALGIPSDSRFQSAIQVVEMAEFQMYIGVSIDTGIEVNRRLFVSSDGFPQAPLTAEAGLGNPADVLFHTYQDFISGTNRGTAGNFEPTGTITKYTPGPSLGA